MFEKYKYRKKTKGYFNPESNIDVSREQFLQILSGDIINPHMFHSSKNRSDYSFMIIGVSEDSSLKSLAGEVWGKKWYENVQRSSDWYAKISCKHDAHLVFHKENLVFYFDPISNYIRGKKFDSKHDLETSLFDGHPSASPEKDLRFLISTLDRDYVLRCMQDYKRRFTLK